jgi:hypothetical protein
MRALFAAALVSALATLVVASPASATFSSWTPSLEHAELTLDSRSSDQVDTPRPLALKRTYLVTVSGVVSFFKQRLWNGEVPNTVVCGTPRAITDPSPGGDGPGIGGVDAETVFASVLPFGCGNWTSGINRQFELRLSTDDGATWENPVALGGVVKQPSADNTYYYLVQGAQDGKYPLSFRLLDTNYTDNNGRLAITVQKAYNSMCLFGGWKRFGVFENVKECVKTIDWY